MGSQGFLKRLKQKLNSNSPGLTVAVVAMVIALTGGAFAAGGGLTSKQKKQVKAIAKAEAKKAQGTGPAGPAGPGGPAGPAGPVGPVGPGGPAGADGDDGESVTGSPITAGGACGTVTGVKYTLGLTSTNVCNGLPGSPGAPGTPGAPGQDAGFNYLFNTDTGETDPGAGKLKLNNAAPGSATVLRISETDNNANSLDTVIPTWLTGATARGMLLVRKVGAPNTFAQFAVKGGIACTAGQQTANPAQCGQAQEGTTPNTFRRINVTFIKSNGTFANNDPVTIAYFASGSPAPPSGAIQTGAWAFTGTTADTNGIRVPISFPAPLPAALGAGNVHFTGDAEFSTFCKGNAANPTPEPGHLCVYANAQEPLENTTLQAINRAHESVGVENGASRTGAMLIFTAPTGEATGSGTFGVRAP